VREEQYSRCDNAEITALTAALENNKNKRKTHSRPTGTSYVKLRKSLKSTQLIVRLNTSSEEKSTVTRQTIPNI